MVYNLEKQFGGAGTEDKPKKKELHGGKKKIISDTEANW
jgi:hypothetical protein